MSTSDLHPEFDDELLSAYLDNELASEERARVEKWLAADPAARQLLDQLRSVSSAVHNLPREVLGTDLRDAILQRAERAMLTSKSTAPSVGGNGAAPATGLRDTLGGYTVGRTRRGWIWAGAAIAAGLLIAAFQMAPQNNRHLPDDVALRLPEALKQPTAGVEIRADHDSQTDSFSATDGASAFKASVPPEASPRSGGFGGGGANGGAIAQNGDRVESSGFAASDLKSAMKSGSPQPNGTAQLQSKTSEMDFVPQTVEAPAGATASSTMPAPAAAPAEVSAIAGAKVAKKSEGEALDGEQTGVPADLLVVHLTCSPDALRNKAFETTLEKSDIVLEDANGEPSKDKQAPALSAAKRLSKQSAERDQSKLADESGSTSQEPEVVVVDAPLANVYRCLDAIDKDTKNFLNVNVDDKLVDSNQDVKDEAHRRTRGIVSQQQEIQVTPENIVNVPTNRGRVELNRNSSYFEDVRNRTLEEQTQEKKLDQNLANRGRARYVEPQDTLSRSNSRQLANEPAQQMSAANAERGTQLGYAWRGVDQKLDVSTPGNLQVLFMLWPSDQPASSSTEQPASSPPIETKVSK